MKYLVVTDRPYYPTVEAFDDRDAARRRYEAVQAAEHEGDGARYESRVYLVTVEDEATIRTSF